MDQARLALTALTIRAAMHRRVGDEVPIDTRPEPTCAVTPPAAPRHAPRRAPVSRRGPRGHALPRRGNNRQRYGA